MTVYYTEMTQLQNGAYFTRMTVAPATLPIKIVSAEYIAGGGGTVNVYRATGATGGTTLTPGALRFGSPAAGAVVRYGTPTVTGTAVYFVNNSSRASPYQPPASVVIGPGSVFVIENTAGNAMSYAGFFFDELEIQPGY